MVEEDIHFCKHRTVPTQYNVWRSTLTCGPFDNNDKNQRTPGIQDGAFILQFCTE